MTIYNVRFSDGPLDGHQFDTSLYVDKLLILTNSGQRVRYECDFEGDFPEPDTRTALNMVLTRDEETYDDELLVVDISDEGKERP